MVWHKKDELGNKYGDLTVIECAGQDKKGKYLWRCRCNCGKKIIISGVLLRRGRKSCGCLNTTSLVGNRYHKLIVIKYAGRNKYKQALWLCKCDCGNEKVISGGSLKHRNVMSCGCLVKLPKGEAARNAILKKIKNLAKRRGYKWELSEKYLEKLIKLPCFYCGTLPSNIYKKQYNDDYAYNGIDRINNNKGYVIGNVVTCCFTCNRAKYTKEVSGFLDWLKQLIIYNKWDCDINSIKFIGNKEKTNV